jgi:hypothetical protein
MGLADFYAESWPLNDNDDDDDDNDNDNDNDNDLDAARVEARRELVGQRVSLAPPAAGLHVHRRPTTPIDRPPRT